MKRPITGFALDDQNDWYATLSCGHRQHVRHRPPFIERPWVTTAAGRDRRLGTNLDCVRCDRFELPEHFSVYKDTAVFTEASIPIAFTADHTTKAGVWAKIVVTEGQLRYIVDTLGTNVIVDSDSVGIIPPQLPHRVTPVGAVRFYLAMYRAPASGD